MGLLLSWLIMSLAVWLTAQVLSGVHVKTFGAAMFTAAILGLLNFVIGWLIFTVLAVATLGIGLLLAFITRWIVNAILLKITDALTDGLEIDNFGWALVGALMISLISSVAELLLRAIF